MSAQLINLRHSMRSGETSTATTTTGLELAADVARRSHSARPDDDDGDVDVAVDQAI